MPHTRSLFAGLIAVIVLAFLAVPASATLLVLDSRSEWEALTSSAFTINFEGLATPSSPGDYSTSAGLTLSGVKFVGEATKRGNVCRRAPARARLHDGPPA